MSMKSDIAVFCRHISDKNADISYFRLGEMHFLCGPLLKLTAFCQIRFRKLGPEYRVDYESCCAILETERGRVEDLKVKISDKDYIWKHNIYPPELWQFSHTIDRLPQDELVSRINFFLITHSKGVDEAANFLAEESTEFLDDLRRFRFGELLQFAARLSGGVAS